MLDEAVQNMLFDCGRLLPGQTVLIVHEPAGHGYYDDALAPAVANSARALGVAVTLMSAPVTEQAQITNALAGAMSSHDLTVFLSRVGDQIRFCAGGVSNRSIVCYAIDLDRFASPFGGIKHSALVALRDRLDEMLALAADIHVTCAVGTDLRGRVSGASPPKDSYTLRFPQLVYTPLPAAGFSGRIAQRGFLVGTGSRFYEPYACPLTGTLIVEIEGNRITSFGGPGADLARSHYSDIAARFAANEDFVHSWHGGIHPMCTFDDPANASFERWSGAAFGNPRLLHFHTCGAYAPGEISLNIVDPSVTVDGIPVWDNGRFMPDRIPGGEDVLADCPELAAAFERPAQACGLNDLGTLSYH
jgi:hypothetical protein